MVKMQSFRDENALPSSEMAGGDVGKIEVGGRGIEKEGSQITIQKRFPIIFSFLPLPTITSVTPTSHHFCLTP